MSARPATKKPWSSAKKPTGRSTPEPSAVSRHRIRNTVQEQILSGVYLPGEKLVQQKLAKSFGAAQSVIREALFELLACGLVEAVDNRGIFVTDLGYDRLLESFDVREVLEGLATRLACDRITRAQIRELRDMVKQIYDLSQSKDKAKEAGILDRGLHEQILRISDNRMLIRVSENYRVLGKVLRGLRPPDVVYQEHTRIIDAIEAGHADKAEQLSREHISRAKSALEKQIAKGTFVAKCV